MSQSFLLRTYFLWPKIARFWFVIFGVDLLSERGQSQYLYGEPDFILGEKNGMTNDCVYSMTEDDNGTIWLGTTKALYKFSEYGLKRVNLAQVDTNCSLMTTKLFKDSRGNVWLGSETKGLFFKGKNDEIVRALRDENGKLCYPHAQVFNISEDSRGKIWFGTSNEGIIIYNPGTKAVSQVGGSAKGQAIRYKSLLGLWKDPVQNSIWAIADDTLLVSFNTDQLKISLEIPIPEEARKQPFPWDDHVIFIDNKRRIWIIISRRNLLRYNLTSQKWEKLYHPGIHSNLVDLQYNNFDNTLVFTIEKLGLMEYDLNKEQFRLLPLVPRRGFPDITNGSGTFFSSNGDFYYFGWYENMEVRHRYPVNVESYRTFDQFSDPNEDKLLSVLEINDSTVLLSTDGRGLFSFNTKTKKVSRIFLKNAKGEDISVTKTIYKSKSGLIFLGHWLDCFSIYDPKTKTAQTIAPPGNDLYEIPDNQTCVWDFAEDHKGRLWVAFLGSKVSCYDTQNKTATHYSSENGLPGLGNSQILDIHCDKQGNIWIVTEISGVYMKPAYENSFRHFQSGKPGGLSDNKCYFLFEKPDGTIFIATLENGLNVYQPKDKTFKYIDQSNGLPTNDISAMASDVFGNTWCIMRKSVFVLIENNNQYRALLMANAEAENHFLHQGVSVSNDGKTIYLASARGIKIMRPKTVYKHSNTLKVQIFDIEIQDQYFDVYKKDSLLSILNETKSIHVFDNHFISFKLNSNGVIEGSDKISYSYFLGGFDKRWHEMEAGKNVITYIGLPEGKYDLSIRAKRKGEGWGEVEKISVKITVPFLKSKVFKFLVTFILWLISSLALYLFFRYRKTLFQKQKLESEKIILTENLDESAASLMAKTVEINYQKEILHEVKDILKPKKESNDLEVDQKIRRIKELIRSEDAGENWANFRLYFDQRNQDFSKRIIKEHPKLTEADIKHCILIRMNLTTLDIAKILNITVAGVQKSRVRLKQKMDLPEEVSLRTYIVQF